MNDGTGVHHYKDAEDNEEYLYTQFEPFYAHKAFPVFDQPDIRAIIELTTFVPEKWVSIGNGASREESVRGSKSFDDVISKIPHGKDFASSYSQEDGCKVNHFNPTPAIASYLFAFAAGPFVCFSKFYNIPGRD